MTIKTPTRITSIHRLYIKYSDYSKYDLMYRKEFNLMTQDLVEKLHFDVGDYHNIDALYASIDEFKLPEYLSHYPYENIDKEAFIEWLKVQTLVHLSDYENGYTGEARAEQLINCCVYDKNIELSNLQDLKLLRLALKAQTNFTNKRFSETLSYLYGMIKYCTYQDYRTLSGEAIYQWIDKYLTPQYVVFDELHKELVSYLKTINLCQIFMEMCENFEYGDYHIDYIQDDNDELATDVIVKIQEKIAKAIIQTPTDYNPPIQVNNNVLCGRLIKSEPERYCELSLHTLFNTISCAVINWQADNEQIEESE